MTTPITYEFQFPVDDDNRRYFVSLIHTSEGNLKQLSIVQDAPPDKPGQVINIDLDPAIFKQTAMPGPEVLSRIAIGQARQDNLFGSASYQGGLLLDFAVEPWEGDLTPLNS